MMTLVDVHPLQAGFPLKTKQTPHELWYEGVTYDKFADIAEYVQIAILWMFI
jgi:hypothetical protein